MAMTENKFKTESGAVVFIERKAKLGEYFDPTDDEYRAAIQRRETIKELEAVKVVIEKRLATLHSECTHEIVYDTEGFPYDTRRCFACDSSQGSI